MSVSVDKLEKGSQAYEMSYRLWHKHFPAMLPNLLQFIRCVDYENISVVS